MTSRSGSRTSIRAAAARFRTFAAVIVVRMPLALLRTSVAERGARPAHVGGPFSAAHHRPVIPLRIARHERHVGALRCQRFPDRQPDAAAAAGDEDRAGGLVAHADHSSTAEAQDKAGTAVARSVRLALQGEFVPDAVNVQAGGVVALITAIVGSI